MKQISFPRSRRARYSFALLPFLAFLAYAATPAKLSQPELDTYLAHVKYLASDELEGRGAGTKGLQLAEQYVAQQFKKAGLQPAGDGSFLQAFTVTTGATMGDENDFEISQADETNKLGPEKDYIPLNFSSSGAVSGGVVFAGYGATADEFHYDDYFHLPVEDKIVVVMRYEPPSFGEARTGNQEEHYTHHAHLVSKAINARNHGAKAVIVVNGDTGKEDELVKFGSVAGPENAGIVIVQVTNAAAEKWFAAAGKSLPELQKSINENKRAQSFVFPDTFKMSLKVDIERKQATIHNVLGYLRGETDEYVIVGAHHDHLGRGDQSSLAPSQIGEIHHGADDNASGTAGVIELARMLAQRGERLRRGILFMTFGGEEIGLLGSADWVEHPTLPLEKAVAMINMDMIGRIRDSKVYVGGVGTGSTFKALVEQAQKHYGMQVDYSKETHSSSDHTSFSSKQIPALFFFSGLHADYHKPSDTWDKINAEGAAKLIAMVGDITTELASEENRPTFSKAEAPRHGGGGDGAGGGGYGPYFGSIPDFGEVERGVKFADVRAGSPADKAGLKAGDILVHFGAKPIMNLYDFTYALRESKVGDVVEVKVLRDEKEVAATVTLEKRP